MDLQKFIDFLEHFSIDEQVYLRVPTKSYTVVEIRWERSLQPFGWSLRPSPEGPWERLTPDHLLKRLADIKVDESHLQRVLGSKILTQAVFAHMVKEAAEKLFGRDSVDSAISNAQTFLSEVKHSVEIMSRPPARSRPPKLRILKHTERA